MDKLKKVLAQWSTFRGFLLMAATILGITNPVAGAAIGIIDHLPEIATGVIGLFEIVRDEKKGDNDGG